MRPAGVPPTRIEPVPHADIAKKPLVIVTRKLPEAVETRMRELFDARLNVDDKPMSQAELAEAVKTAHVLVPTVTDRIDRVAALPGRAAAQADRQFRQRRGQHRSRHRARARHHRHQHAGRADRGHRRHDHGADPGRAAPAGRGHGAAEGPGKRTGRAGRPPGCWATASAASGSASSAWAASARRWRAAPRPSACRSTTTTAAASPRRSSRSWRRPTGTASTRCWRAWTSSRSTARTRRRPITCCRRGG